MNLTDLLRRNWVLLLGLLSLAIPTLSDLATTLWNKTDQEHGPIVFVLVCWVLWRELPAFLPLPNKTAKWGWLLIIPALLAYVLGHSQEIWMLEVGAFIPLLAGITLLDKGWAGLKAMRAPLLFLHRRPACGFAGP